MSQAATTMLAEAICANAGLTLMSAKKLAAGIDPSRFARMSTGVESNHPAFCYGHLSIYPDWLLGHLGREDLCDPREGYKELFGQGVACRDDPDGSVYPSMEELTSYCFARHEALIGALRDADESAMSAPNPSEEMRDMLPTMGSVMMFMLCGHAMFHLGQISAWRRMEGMGSAMGY